MMKHFYTEVKKNSNEIHIVNSRPFIPHVSGKMTDRRINKSRLQVRCH